MEFTTTVNDIDIWDFKEICKPAKDKVIEDASSQNMTVDWEFQVETRRWGIKGISILVKKVRGVISYEEYDADNDDTCEDKNFAFDVCYTDDEWDIDYERVDDGGDTWTPENVAIDFKEKQITVNF